MGKLSVHRYTILSALASIICGFLHALPRLGGIPPQEALFSAARGLASLHRLTGYNPPSLLDSLNGWLWRAGGVPLLAWGQWFLVFFAWTLAAFVALTILRVVVRFLKNLRTRRIVCGLAVVFLLAGGLPEAWAALVRRQEKISDPKLFSPVELIEQAREFGKGELFANASGQVHLLLFAPEAAGAIAPDQAARLANNPAVWREALRQEKWQAVLLTGPLTEYRPLLDHLITSPDWHLSAVNNQGYLFLRGPGLTAKSLEVESLQFSSDLETAVYLAQISERYDAVGRTTEARACIERAVRLAPGNASVLAYAATFAAAHKRWQDAISLSNKALAADPDFAQAKIVQALALLEIKDPGGAQRLIEQVLARNPADLYTLFLYARISRALNDHAQEAATLEKIIALSTAAGLPVINYQIYLGQAYARMGQAKPALENYRAVLAGGQLNKEQAAEIQDAITTIETREKP